MNDARGSGSSSLASSADSVDVDVLATQAATELPVTIRSEIGDPALAPTETETPASRPDGESELAAATRMLSLDEVRAIRTENRQIVERARDEARRRRALLAEEQRETIMASDDKKTDAPKNEDKQPTPPPPAKSELPVAPKASAPSLKKFRVWPHGSLKHDGKEYAPGELCELPAELEAICPALTPAE